MSASRLVRLRGEQDEEFWALLTDRANLVGRHDAGLPPPDVDLWPDGKVSRRHARIWSENDQWWIEDLQSRYGTRLLGDQLQPGAPVALGCWAEVEFGQTTLLFASPRWHRLRSRHVLIDLELAPVLNLSLAHTGWSPVARLVVRNRGREELPSGHLEIAISGWAQTGRIAIPDLRPGGCAEFAQPEFQFDWGALEGQAEPVNRGVSVLLDGQPLDGEHLECWVLAPNEFSLSIGQHSCLAAFALPNHPLVFEIASDAFRELHVGSPPEQFLQALYEHLYSHWRLSYCHEPPNAQTGSQKIRFPQQLLVMPEQRIGQGTCIDLALLMAACLESRGVQPLIAVFETGLVSHALVGCWREARAGLDPIITEVEHLVEQASWTDPNGCTRDPRYRREFGASQELALQLCQNAPLLFALDVAAARRDGIRPLPFAGEPRWSEPLRTALSEAVRLAHSIPTRIGTVPLLIALLKLPNGFMRTLFLDRFDDVPGVINRLTRNLPKEELTDAPSANYFRALALAQLQAKAAGSPLVLERHLLSVLLTMEGTSFDTALRMVGASRPDLRKAVQSTETSVDMTAFGHSAFFEFNLQPPDRLE